jgi:hypothetical protein
MYTSGRWLNRDELERNSRRIVFDFSALRDRAISLCPGATKIVKCEKREGGFNRVFLFTMDTGSCAVARLPTGIAGPPRLTTNSEVATMTYCRADLHTSLLGRAVDMFTDCCFMYSTIQNLASNTQDPRLER